MTLLDFLTSLLAGLWFGCGSSQWRKAAPLGNLFLALLLGLLLKTNVSVSAKEPFTLNFIAGTRFSTFSQACYWHNCAFKLQHKSQNSKDVQYSQYTEATYKIVTTMSIGKQSNVGTIITFILLASSLAYSEASSLFFWVRCLFREMRRRLCCSTRGVTSLWILGALVLGFLPVRKRIWLIFMQKVLKEGGTSSLMGVLMLQLFCVNTG